MGCFGKTQREYNDKEPFHSAAELTIEAFLVSTGIVALAEMGDKTQLLALILAARFRKPWPIVSGIFVATIANHALAGAAGAWVTTLLGPDVLRWVLSASFIAMAVWMLIPDSVDDDEASGTPRFGVFGTTVLAFFLAEMGDKTQIATVMLAAQYQAWGWVVAGTTLGMMLANAPVVWLGDKITKLVPLRVVHVVSALIFLGLGLFALLA
jgi:putative Ca2+/H+ antiporter (TMEM165/GDT1 family)